MTKHESISTSGAPTITFDVEGDTIRAELAGTKLYERLARVLNDRSGFHVDGLDEETRADLLDAITKAVLG
jgi:hypothetical protein